MSDLIEQLKKSEELCKDTYSESTIITKLTLRRIISALEESVKEPQSSVSDLISRKKLLEVIENMTPLEVFDIKYLSKNMIKDYINNQSQVQPICCGCTYDYEHGYLDARLKADGWTKQPIVRSKDELIDVLVHVDCDDCPVRNHCMGCFHTTDKECREHLSDWLTGKEV